MGGTPVLQPDQRIEPRPRRRVALGAVEQLDGVADGLGEGGIRAGALGQLGLQFSRALALAGPPRRQVRELVAQALQPLAA